MAHKKTLYEKVLTRFAVIIIVGVVVKKGSGVYSRGSVADFKVQKV